MVSEGDRPRSSWQSWVRSSERRRPATTEGPIPARPEAASPEPSPAEPAPSGPVPAVESAVESNDDDLDVSLDWGDAGSEGPVDLGKREPAGSRTEAGGEPDAADDADDGGFDALEPDGFDDLDDDFAQDDDNDRGDGADEAGREPDDLDGELLPAVPLLPSIAGRVDALSGLLRSITMRIDGLSAASDVYRSTITDRIDEYTETILALSRQSDQTLDGFRRASERTTAELRREASDRSEAISQLVARVEELSTDVATLVDAAASPTDDSALRAELASLREMVSAPVADTALLEELASLREMVSAPVADTAVLEELAALRELMSARDDVPAAAEQPAVDLEPVLEEVRALTEAQAGRQEATERALAELRTLVEVIVDTMPASAEGSGANLAEGIESLQVELQDLKGRLPAKGTRALLTRADLDHAVELIAEAVVARIDVDGIVEAVVHKMESAFEVVEPETAAPPPPKPPGRSRRKG